MRTLDPVLRTAISQRSVVCADLFEFDIWGQTYTFTSCDRDLTVGAVTYEAVNIGRGRIRASDGLEIDDFEIEVAHGTAGDFNGYTWISAALADVFDEVPVRAYRAVLEPSTWAVIGSFLRFSGVVTDVEPGSTMLRLVVAASSNDFGRPFPNATYEKKCVWVFGGPGCDFPDAISFPVTVGIESTNRVLHIAALPGGLTIPSLFFSGSVTASNESRTIVDAGAAGDGIGIGTEVTTGFAFELSPAFPSPLFVGSTVSLVRGCVKEPWFCGPVAAGGLLDNLHHFMGAPIAPAKP